MKEGDRHMYITIQFKSASAESVERFTDPNEAFKRIVEVADGNQYEIDKYRIQQVLKVMVKNPHLYRLKAQDKDEFEWLRVSMEKGGQ